MFGDLANRLLFLFFLSGLSCWTLPSSASILTGHYETSIKHGSQEEKNKGYQPVRRMIENRVIPMPAKHSSGAV